MPAGFPTRFNTTAKAVLAALASLTIASSLTLSSMTAGSVLFTGTGGLVSQDNSNFFWDDANNRLGIGTATPSSKLTVFQTPTNTDGTALDTERLTIDGSTTGNLARGIDFSYGGAISHSITSNAASGKLRIYGRAAGYYMEIFGGMTGGNAPALAIGNATTGFSASSTQQYGVKIDFPLNQSGTASFTGLHLDVTGTGGSGTQYLLDLQRSSVSRFAVANSGIVLTPTNLTGSSSTSALSIAQTWNTTGAPTAIKLNVTDTASNSASLLMDLQVGGTSYVNITKSANASFGSSSVAGSRLVDIASSDNNATVRFIDRGSATGYAGSINSLLGLYDASGVAGVTVATGGLVAVSTTTGITASTTQSQGQQPLTTSVNNVTTVANANDVVTLPAAAVGNFVMIKNNGANTLQVFPASGDSIDGGAADASVTIAAGASVTYIAISATDYQSFN